MVKVLVECGTHVTEFEPTQAELDACVREAAEDFLTACSEFGVMYDDDFVGDSIETLMNAVNLACTKKDPDD